jgi:PTH1 family peptidyl-tRNA hydrolase
MILIVGLGNPGKKYAQTRHNAGFLFLDHLVGCLGVSNQWSDKKTLKSSIIKQSLPQISNQKPTTDDLPLILAKPQTFMNSSGLAVKKLINFYKIKPPLTRHSKLARPAMPRTLRSTGESNGSGGSESSFSSLYVVHDDLDIRLGQFKLQFAKSPRDHKGLQSIYHHLKTDQFWHLRLGVDHRAPDHRVPGEDYVLQNFTPQELITFNQVLDQAVEALLKHLQS